MLILKIIVCHQIVISIYQINLLEKIDNIRQAFSD
jgi:hypothetical protein